MLLKLLKSVAEKTFVWGLEGHKQEARDDMPWDVSMNMNLSAVQRREIVFIACRWRCVECAAVMNFLEVEASRFTWKH